VPRRRRRHRQRRVVAVGDVVHDPGEGAPWGTPPSPPALAVEVLQRWARAVVR
jgi:hypothetical protein